MGREEEAGISEGIESVKRPGGESPCLKGEQMGILNAPLHPDLLELAKVFTASGSWVSGRLVCLSHPKRNR